MWLTTTCSRPCPDVLRSARVRREAYRGQWLPEPMVTGLPADGFASDPAERAVRVASRARRAVHGDGSPECSTSSTRRR